ncbi:MAG: NADH-quinone oxidoreductase subunit M [Candidatus Micrarchaeota archaeon]|nr:MAG: NADH-quinone oxidoreductase subunit M [Candidatus Micrarchaeota archaeon]
MMINYLLISPLILGLIALFGSILLDYKKGKALSAMLYALSIMLFIYMLLYYNSGFNLELSYSYINLPIIQFSLVYNNVRAALLIMTSIVTFVSLISGDLTEEERSKASNILISLFFISATGLFLSNNLVLFFIFWDIGLVSMFFMIYLLGSVNRRMAARKFMFYEILASLSLLTGIMIIYFYLNIATFQINALTSAISSLPLYKQIIPFIFILFAFLINMPIFPFHNWLPDAHSEASTQGSMLLSGVLTKYGAFGALLLYIIFPDVIVSYGFYIGLLAIISSIYASILILRQRDIKRAIAYSTIVELGIILFAITAAYNTLAFYGSVYAMLAHGLVIAMMFLVAGAIRMKYQIRDVNILSGIVHTDNRLAYAFLFGVFTIAGMPLTSSFIGDLLIAFGSVVRYKALTVLPFIALFINVAVFYYIYQKSFVSRKKYKPINKLDPLVYTGIFILIASILLFGVFSYIILE